jgi:WD40 repeat protein
MRHGFVVKPLSKTSNKSFFPDIVMKSAFIGDSQKFWTLTIGGIIRSWDLNKNSKGPISKRIISSETKLHYSKYGKYIFLYDKISGTISKVNASTLVTIATSSEDRLIDSIQPIGPTGEFLLVISHEVPHEVTIGYGALEVPYYAEIRTANLKSTNIEYKFESPITASAVAPDGDTFAIGDADGMIHILKRSVGPFLAWFETSLPIRFLEFTPNGQTIAASVAPASTGGKLIGTNKLIFRVWNPAELINLACKLLPRSHSNLFAEYQATANHTAMMSGSAINGCLTSHKSLVR